MVNKYKIYLKNEISNIFLLKFLGILFLNFNFFVLKKRNFSDPIFFWLRVTQNTK